MSKEGGEKKQNSIILTYAGEKKDGERFNNQEDYSSENYMCFPNDNNIENSDEEINIANVAQVQSNEPNNDFY